MQKRIVVLGAAGNMGRRYSHILKLLGCEVTERDLHNIDEPFEAEMGMVATTTDTHLESIRRLVDGNVKSILCEKPVSKSLVELQEIKRITEKYEVDFRMVCNWCQCTPISFNPGTCVVEYNNWRTGNDGLYWDVIQLIHLARSIEPSDLSIDKQSPVFHASINGIDISLTDIDRSYVWMMLAWLNTPQYLWGMEDAIQATQKTLKVIEERGQQ